MYRIDLHTHSAASADGSLTVLDYEQMLKSKKLNYLAITDHNCIQFAQKVQNQLGQAIIVGEEILTSQGEIIGLFLNDIVTPNMTAKKTIDAIRSQGGLVYIPHPLESSRHGLSLTLLQEIASEIDIIEVYNGRTRLHAKDKQIAAFANEAHIAMAASSDAHGLVGWGKTCSIIAQKPTPIRLAESLRSGSLVTHSVGLRGLLYPSINRVRKKRKKHVE